MGKSLEHKMLEILTKHGGCHKKIPRLWGEVRDGLIF